MDKSIVGEKAYTFALRIVKAYKFLNKDQKEFILFKQLLKSGTAICALIRESQYAQSDLDFIN